MRIAHGLGCKRGIGGGRILEWEYAPDGAWHVQYGDDKAGYERAKEAQRSKDTCVKVTYHAVGGGGGSTDAVGGGGRAAVAGGGSAPVCHGVVNVPFRHLSG